MIIEKYPDSAPWPRPNMNANEKMRHLIGGPITVGQFSIIKNNDFIDVFMPRIRGITFARRTRKGWYESADQALSAGYNLKRQWESKLTEGNTMIDNIVSVFMFQRESIFRDIETGDPIENQQSFQGLCLVYGGRPTFPGSVMMTWLVPMNDEDEPERFERAWGIPGGKEVPVTIMKYQCRTCRKTFTMKFFDGDFVVIPSPDDICPECWELEEKAKYARIGLSEAFGPGEAVFDGAS